MMKPKKKANGGMVPEELEPLSVVKGFKGVF
jgi:hypothetical protein